MLAFVAYLCHPPTIVLTQEDDVWLQLCLQKAKQFSVASLVCKAVSNKPRTTGEFCALEHLCS